MKRFLATAAVVGLCLVGAGALLVVSVSCTGMACHGMSCHEGAGAPVAAAALGSGAPVVFANTKCPIMGNPIDPAKVPESLTRVYKDQRVAFCCPMCLPTWDRLTDAQKDAKLAGQLASK